MKNKNGKTQAAKSDCEAKLRMLLKKGGPYTPFVLDYVLHNDDCNYECCNPNIEKHIEEQKKTIRFDSQVAARIAICIVVPTVAWLNIH